MSENKTCFIITPIGGNNTSIRRHADGVIDAVIAPVLEKNGFQIIVAHRISEGGSITRQVIQNIIDADLVVANLTGLNPNVMYELAIRHAIRKPLIQICEEDNTQLPFDINEQRTIFYTNDMQGVVELTNRFEDMLVSAINDEKPDNPIYRAIKLETIIQKEDVSSTDKFILTRMDELERTFLKALNNFQPKRVNRKDYSSYTDKDLILLSDKDINLIRKNIKELMNQKIEVSPAILISHLRNRGFSYPIELVADVLIDYIDDVKIGTN